MQVQVQLVHAESGRRVVLASAERNGTRIAAALGEGSTAEEAEDRARQRLRLQLEAQTPPTAAPAEPPPSEPPPETTTQRTPKRSATPAPRPAPPEPPAEAQQPDEDAQAPQEPAPDPEDWSSELAQLELQLKRLGWGREQEAVLLQRAFGHGSRSRLTRYGDLMAYLRTLESLNPGADPASCAIPLRRSDLLLQSDQLLSQLQWDANQGRRLLESRFGRSSRQQLSDAQLLEFNMVLEGELLSRDALSSGD